MQRAALIDYGSGNLRSAEKALVRAADGKAKIVVTHDPAVIAKADRVVLPGQGAIHDCMRELRESGLEGAVRAAAASKPLMGVCIGMQMLLERSEEGPDDGPTSASGSDGPKA